MKVDISNLEFHPLAAIFPLLDKAELQSLADDIFMNGLQEPIVLHDGMILDGRNRYRAMVTDHVDGAAIDFGPRHMITFADHCVDKGLTLTPLQFVIAKNLRRRHLNESQRAWAASQLATMRQGARTDLADDYKLTPPPAHGEPAPATAGEVSQREAGELFKVSERLVSAAVAVAKTGVETLADGVRDGTVPLTVAEEISKMPADDQKRAMAETKPGHLKTVAKKFKRERKEKALGNKQAALPSKKFGVIYADPPWKFEPRSDQGGLEKSADNHYPTMTAADIKALPICDLAADDCVVWLWVTVPCLEHGLAALDSWGFSYASHYIWQKDKIGHGFWNRNNHEILLIGTRGNIPCPAPGSQLQSCLEYPTGKHSEKPVEFAYMIEHYYPTLPKIELFARHARKGWERWGKEAPDGQADIEDTLAGNGSPKEWTGHNNRTDQIIIDGYAAKKAVAVIGAELGLQKKRLGIVRGRAFRLGVSDPARAGERTDLKA